MDRRDQELLATQMRAITPPGNGVGGLMVVTIFLLGLAFGGLLFAPHGDRAQNGPRLAAMSPPADVPPS